MSHFRLVESCFRIRFSNSVFFCLNLFSDASYSQNFFEFFSQFLSCLFQLVFQNGVITFPMEYNIFILNFDLS